MDVFGTIKNGIDAARDIRRLIEGIKGAPETLNRLRNESQGIDTLFEGCREALESAPEVRDKCRPLLQNVERGLETIRQAVKAHQRKSAAGGLSFRDAFRVHRHEDKFGKYVGDVQSYRSILTLMCMMRVTHSQEAVEKMLKQLGATVNGRATRDNFQFSNPSHTFEMPGDSDEDIELACKNFLSTLIISDVNDDFDKIDDAKFNTCNWVYDHSAYLSWIDSPESCTLHLVGRMGCGKSVLTKSILRQIRHRTPNPASPSDDIATLFYFCDGVTRPAESASTMLQSLIHQFLRRRPLLFRSVIQQTEILDTHQQPGRSGDWSLSSLWKILTTVLLASPHCTVYCVIDALDECNEASAQKFLSLYHETHASETLRAKTIKFLISSRRNRYILDGLSTTPRVGRLSVTTSLVTPDIQLVLNERLEIFAEQFNIEPCDKEELQNRLAERADGMFQWATTALKEICDADYRSFEALLDMIDELPPGLKELYNRAFQKILRSLDVKNVELIKRVLTWVLLATQPLTVSELTIALAIKPGDTEAPARRKRIPSIARFISRYLAPFIEVVGAHSDSKTEGTHPDSLNDPKATIRPVHKSALDFLHNVCLQDSMYINLNTFQLRISKHGGHEELATACLTYLCCREMQFGWSGDSIADTFGQILVDSQTKALLKTHLENNEFLGYSVMNWAIHMRQSENREAGDIYDLALRYLRGCPKGVTSSFQISQYLQETDREVFWPPRILLTSVARQGSFTLVERFLPGALYDINEVDSTGCTTLMDVCGSFPLNAAPDASKETVKICRLLLEAGSRLSVVDKFGRTALHWAAIGGQPEVMSLLLESPLKVDADPQESYKIKYAIFQAHQIPREGGVLGHQSGEPEQLTLDTESQDLMTSIHDHPEFLTPILTKTNLVVDAKDDRDSACFALASHGRKSETVPYLHSCSADLNIPDIDGDAPLLHAAYAGHVDIVRLLVNSKANIEVYGNDGWTALHCAAYKGYKDSLDVLLNAGAKVDSRTSKLSTALHVAAQNGQVACCQKLLIHGADAEALNEDGETPLLLAVVYDHIDTLHLLLNHGANIYATSLEGLSLLHLACVNGHVRTMKALLDNYVDPDAMYRKGFDPLHLALEYKQREVAKFLILRNCPDGPDDSTRLSLAALENFESFTQVVGEYDPALLKDDSNLGAAALEIAARLGNLEIVKSLLELGVDCSLLIFKTGTQLVKFQISDNTTNVLEYLLVQGVLDINARDDCGHTLLHWAVYAESLKTFDMLLNRITDILAWPDSCYQILRTAAMHNKNSYMLEKLLEPRLGLNINDNTGQGYNILGFAALVSKREVVEYLIDKGAEISTKSKYGETLLHLVMRNNREEVGKYVLSLDLAVPINAQDSEGITCLHYASRHRSLEVVKIILAAGGSSSVADNMGWQALHYAVERGDANIVRLLINEGADVANANVDIRGRTVVQLAASGMNEEVITVLLEHWCSYEPDINGWVLSDVVSLFESLSLKHLLSELPYDGASIGGAMKTPTSWNTEDKADGLEVSDNGCMVELSKNIPHCDFGMPINSAGAYSGVYSIRTDFCIPGDVDEWYFEVDILEDGDKLSDGSHG